jgi:hypothetical protein
MANLDVKALATDMLTAEGSALQRAGERARTYATAELGKLAASVAEVGTLLAAGRITGDDAQRLVTMQKNAARAVLAATEVMGAVAADGLLAGALSAVAHKVNDALGFPLLPAP